MGAVLITFLYSATRWVSIGVKKKLRAGPIYLYMGFTERAVGWEFGKIPRLEWSFI